jgi:hypothetical protein
VTFHADLTTVIDRWHLLPEAVRAGILAHGPGDKSAMSARCSNACRRATLVLMAWSRRRKLGSLLVCAFLRAASMRLDDANVPPSHCESSSSPGVGWHPITTLTSPGVMSCLICSNCV